MFLRIRSILRKAFIKAPFFSLFGCFFLLATSCASLGSKAIKAERVNFNAALQQTADEQLLLDLLRLRYRDTSAFLEVTSISTQSQFQTTFEAGAELERAKVNTDKDLFKITGGLGYSTQPTLTYTPLQGENFIQRVLSPLTLDKLMLLYRSGWNIRRLFRLCVQRLNDVKYAPRASGPTPEETPEYQGFMRALDLMQELERRDLLELAYEAYPPADSPPRLVMEIAGEAQGKLEMLELLRILGLEPGKTHYPLVYPVARHMQPEDRDHLRVETRSLLGMLYFLSQSVDVPEKYRQKGKVTITKDEAGNPFDWKKVLGDSLQIRTDAFRPVEAAMAVRYRGTWFYIDDSDLESKSTISLLSQVFTLQAGKSEGVGPVLTLPVGR